MTWGPGVGTWHRDLVWGRTVVLCPSGVTGAELCFLMGLSKRQSHKKGRKRSYCVTLPPLEMLGLISAQKVPTETAPPAGSPCPGRAAQTFPPILGFSPHLSDVSRGSHTIAVLEAPFGTAPGAAPAQARLFS